MPLLGPLFDLTGKYVQGLLLAPEMGGSLWDYSRGVRWIFYLILPVRDESVFTPLLRRTG